MQTYPFPCHAPVAFLLFYDFLPVSPVARKSRLAKEDEIIPPSLVLRVSQRFTWDGPALLLSNSPTKATSESCPGVRFTTERTVFLLGGGKTELLTGTSLTGCQA